MTLHDPRTDHDRTDDEPTAGLRDFDPTARYGRRGAERLRRGEREAHAARLGTPDEHETDRDPDEPFVGWGFVIGRRWVGYFAIAVGFAILCAFFGMWQWDRRNEAVRENDQIAQNYDHTPVPVDRALPTRSAFDDDQTWLQVRVTGHYDVAEQLLVRNRVHNGQPGFEVLTPLVTSSGRAFIVDRGWVPTGNDHDYPDSVPAPPRGTVDVVVRLQQTEPHIPGRTDPAHTDEIQSVTLSDVAGRVAQPIWTGAYGQLKSEDPAPAQARPLGWDRPSADTGLHLSYFIQWFMFAAGGFGFLAYLMVQEYRNLNQDDPEERERALERKRRREARPKTDAEIEDGLLDDVRVG
ncbi:SURF1 family protein [Curtobacterium sp. MCBD17_040]|uniref:SURF1 family cytochrome oxidase biogenesis protein n=1 Tax=Curtobacterium sp. MCBD17_040 TaxID=2175674 RepID=UPI000DA92FE8|nr:SURF1 family protein [Curtobacterium sp. MCBD17_040]WIB62247.1 SURF1 family protein [Curtobacterium sp. MCBD17_040]